MGSPSICRLSFWSMTTPSSGCARYCCSGAYSLGRASHSASRDRRAFASADPTERWSRRNACQGNSIGRQNSAQPRTKRTRDRLLLTKGTNRLPCDAKDSSQSHQCAGSSRPPIGQDYAACLEVRLQRVARCTGTQGKCTEHRRGDVTRCGGWQHDYHRNERPRRKGGHRRTDRFDWP